MYHVSKCSFANKGKLLYKAESAEFRFHRERERERERERVVKERERRTVATARADSLVSVDFPVRKPRRGAGGGCLLQSERSGFVR
ncbi:hypothetical protein BT93_L2701 [Corymbia citriodora subsp. variegata]|uniref:Uncharacterized protein n=1 Tax=Corymbia citriodora subsp. variegata TaxID=360336 RepID=A0A8T0CKE5_CORYI|nr:hypothetical protein BT93_L2701 [Corymbia citriodora subsp. variegata]